MSEDPKFLAVRRNLQPGYIAFKQNGCRLFYTLDNVSWRLAFDYSLCTTKETLSTVQLIRQLVDTYGEDIPLHVDVEGTATQTGQVALSGMICALAKWIIEGYTEIVRAALEAQADESLSFTSVMLALGAALVGIAAALVTGGVSLGISATALSYMGASMGLAALGANVGAHFQNVAPLTDEQKASLECCIVQALKTEFSRASLSSIGCADVPSEHLAAFNEIMAQPETWAGIVLAVNEGSVPSGEGCCGENCAYILPAAAAEIGPNTTRKTPILIDNDSGAPTALTANEKSLYARYTLATPRKITSVSVDIYTRGLYSQAGGLLVRLTDIIASATVQGSDTSTLTGVQTYTLPIIGGGVPSVSQFAIKVQIARVNKTYVAQWNEATAEIRAIRYCYNE